MPIRFRCAYCNQLLGIARRKAGQVVRCPTCAGQVVVPQPEDGDDDAPAADETSAATSPPVFERSDFDELFNAPAGPAPAAGAPPPPPAEVFDVEPVSLPPAPAAAAVEKAARPAGILLSPARATLLTVAAVMALAVAFGAGLLVGLALRAAPPPPTVPAAPAGQLEGRLSPPDAPRAYG